MGLEDVATQLAGQISAHFWRALAAVLHQKGQQTSHAGIVSPVVNKAAFALGFNKTSALQHSQMMRHG